MNRRVSMIGTVLMLGALGAVGGCDTKTQTPTPAKPAPGASTPTPAAAHDEHGHGAEVALGSTTIGPYTVTVVREGAVAEGAEAAFEISITGGTEKVGAVRGWIGVEGGGGSMKGKAEVEGEGFHLHAEAPKPLPAGSKLWIEIEDAKGAKSVGSIDLKS